MSISRSERKVVSIGLLWLRILVNRILWHCGLWSLIGLLELRSGWSEAFSLVNNLFCLIGTNLGCPTLDTITTSIVATLKVETDDYVIAHL